jgi:hypothetical protein
MTMCDSEQECRGRAERHRLEQEIERYREREAHFAKALQVADGGQYRADWDGAIATVVQVRDEYRALWLAEENRRIAAEREVEKLRFSLWEVCDEYEAAMLRLTHDATWGTPAWVRARAALASASPAPTKPDPTHRCKVCGALWILNPPSAVQPDGSWSLWSVRCGPCCDNATMGEQIEPITNFRRACDPGPMGAPASPAPSAAFDGKCKDCGYPVARHYDVLGNSLGCPAPSAEPESIEEQEARHRREHRAMLAELLSDPGRDDRDAYAAPSAPAEGEKP